MSKSRTGAHLPRMSSALRRLLRGLYQAEPLEQRILLSADPAAAISQLFDGAGQDATVVAWEELSRRPAVEEAMAAGDAPAESFSVDQAAFGESGQSRRAAFMDTTLAEDSPAFSRFMDEVL